MLLAVLLAAAPMCGPTHLSLSVDGKDGDFNGMSHSGTLMVLRNRGRLACQVPGLPHVTFRDRRGRALPIARQVPVGTHPGPVIVPVRIAAHAKVSAPLRWVSGPVYDDGRCYDAAWIGMKIGSKTLRAPLTAHICGPASGATFEQPVLATGRR